MSMRKIIIISLVALMLLGCASTVSAGLFDFLKQETKTEISSTPDGSVFVSLKSSDKFVENKPMTVEVSSNGASKTFTINSTKQQVLVCNLVPGTYTVTAKFAGDDSSKASNATQTVQVTELSQGAVSEALTDLSKQASG